LCLGVADENDNEPVTKGDLNAGLRDLNAGLRDLEQRIDARFEGIENKIEGIENKIEGIENKIEGIDNRMVAMENRLLREIGHALNVAVEQIGGKISVLDDKYKDLPARVSVVERDVAELKTRLPTTTAARFRQQASGTAHRPQEIRAVGAARRDVTDRPAHEAAGRGRGSADPPWRASRRAP
jgi:archaellum component FlaC